MKRIFLLGILLAVFLSCNPSDDGPDFNIEILPIESVEIPDEFEMGEVYPITVSYLRPSTCHFFRNFYYERDSNERTVAVINSVLLSEECEDLEDEIVESTFNFIVTSSGSYIFKFWQGEDSNGENQYLTIEVPVIE